MKSIDALTANQVYNDPVKKAQEEMLSQLLLVRESMAKSIDDVCKSGGGAGGASGEVVSMEQHKKVVADNKKLKYRVAHLLRALEEQDGGAPSGGSGAAKAGAAVAGAAGGGDVGMKLCITSGSNALMTNLCQIVSILTGTTLNFHFVTEEEMSSKEHIKANPIGTYPCLMVNEGTLSGVKAICKYLVKTSKKLNGAGTPLENS